MLSDEGDVFSQREWEHLVKKLELPPRQREIAHLLCDGLGDKQIARSLRIELPTVRTHMGRLFAKIGARGRQDVLLKLFRESRRLCSSVRCPLRGQ